MASYQQREKNTVINRWSKTIFSKVFTTYRIHLCDYGLSYLEICVKGLQENKKTLMPLKSTVGIMYYSKMALHAILNNKTLHTTHWKQYSLHTLPLPVPAPSSPSCQYASVSVSCAPCYASCWPKMTIDCSATAFVIRLGWILHLNHFIIYVPNSCQCHLEAVWLVIHHALSFTVVINIVWMDLHHETSGWKGMQISSGRGSGYSKQESTEGRLSGVLATRRNR